VLTSFSIEGFRTFSKLKIDRLAQVNLIVGRNNVGKTALLEALRLHSDPGNGGLPNEINEDRGIERPLRSYEETTGWLFFGRVAKARAEFSGRDSSGSVRTLTLNHVDVGELSDQFPEADKIFRGALSAGGMPTSGLIMVRTSKVGGRESYAIGLLRNNGFVWTGLGDAWTVPTTFLNTGTPSASRDVRYFGELEASKRQDEILRPLQIVEPRLQRLALIPLVGETAIHGDIGLPRLLPIQLMGEGMRRVLSLILAIAHTRGGSVLVDEIENGLHYSIQDQMWQAIVHAACEHDVQLFATTHSWECIEAFQAAAAAMPDVSFQLLRLERHDQNVEAVLFEKDELPIVTRDEIEVR
jgi:hypothetical protein